MVVLNRWNNFLVKGERNLEKALAFVVITSDSQNCYFWADEVGSDYRCFAPADAAGFDDVHGFSLKWLTYVIGKNIGYQSSFSIFSVFSIKNSGLRYIQFSGSTWEFIS